MKMRQFVIHDVIETADLYSTPYGYGDCKLKSLKRIFLCKSKMLSSSQIIHSKRAYRQVLVVGHFQFKYRFKVSWSDTTKKIWRDFQILAKISCYWKRPKGWKWPRHSHSKSFQRPDWHDFCLSAELKRSQIHSRNE